MTLDRLAEPVTPALVALSIPAGLVTTDKWVAASTPIRAPRPGVPLLVDWR